MPTTPSLSVRLLNGRLRNVLGSHRSDSLAVIVLAIANWRRRKRLSRASRSRLLGQRTDLELRLLTSQSKGGHGHG